MEVKLKIVFSMMAFGTIAIFVKNILLSSGEIALYRAIIASAAIIVLTPYVYATTGVNIGSLGNIQIVNLLVLGIVHTGICYVLYFSSLKGLNGQEAAI